jgi:hypothetical protein
MRRRQILVGLTTCFFAAGVLLVAYGKAESATSAEAHATAAREQVALARENAARAAQEAAIAEQQAARAGQRLKAHAAREIFPKDPLMLSGNEW